MHWLSECLVCLQIREELTVRWGLTAAWWCSTYYLLLLAVRGKTLGQQGTVLQQHFSDCLWKQDKQLGHVCLVNFRSCESERWFSILQCGLFGQMRVFELRWHQIFKQCQLEMCVSLEMLHNCTWDSTYLMPCSWFVWEQFYWSVFHLGK